MDEQLLFERNEARFLQELVRQKVDFMVVGLAAAALQGAPVVTQDIDLWFADLTQPGIQKALRKVGGVYVPPIGLHPPAFAGEGVKMFDVVVHMHGLGSFATERRRAALVTVGRARIPVLSLPRIIRSKKATGRHKDKLALPVLADALKTQAALQEPPRQPRTRKAHI